MNCKKTTCTSFIKILVVNESDVRQTKYISEECPSRSVVFEAFGFYSLQHLAQRHQILNWRMIDLLIKPESPLMHRIKINK